MSDDTKKQLQTQLWNIANTLRGKMGADEFRDYILGFIFYKYLSERMHLFADEILKHDGIQFDQIDETKKQGKEMLAAIQEEAIERLGYFLKPSELFHKVAEKGARKTDNFILGDLGEILKHIEASTMGHGSEDDFEGLFEDLDLGSSKLGKTESQKNGLIAKVLSHLDKIDFRLADTEADVLGDAYEYLIGQFASGAGKKAGEFYTPQEVSTILARIVTTGKKRLKSVYDPTCGSASLLLRVAKEVKDVGKFYGQEMNPTTFNLARMNMILHGVHYQRFDIKNEDTLEHPAPEHADLRFEAIVANPPFSAKWSASAIFESDDRFSAYGKLAPSGKADFAFVQHMVHHLDFSGTMAVVLPHGVLSRPGAEAQIRRYLVGDLNYLDAVIGLPENIFWGTEIPVCILVFKKNRSKSDKVFFIDASREFVRITNQNRLREEDVERIVDLYRKRKDIPYNCRASSLKKIAGNEFNLKIPFYVEQPDQDAAWSLPDISAKLKELDSQISAVDERINKFCKMLKIPSPAGQNLFFMLKYREEITRMLFSREISFTTKSGKDFPDWNEATLKELVSKVKSKNVSLEHTLVLTNSATRGIIGQRDYFTKDIANKNNIGGYYIVQSDDFVYNPRISASAPVGPVKRNHLETGIMSPLYRVFRFKTGCLDYFEAFFESTIWHCHMKNVANYGARHDRMNIGTEDFYALPIPLPSSDEQVLIARFILALTDKITLLRYNEEENDSESENIVSV
jgi:type I restriction enzyme M protein